MVKDTLNPFDNNLEKERLFNLGTGKCSNAARERFITECVETHRGLSYL